MRRPKTAGTPKTPDAKTENSFMGILTPLYLEVRFITAIAPIPKKAFIKRVDKNFLLFIAKNKIIKTHIPNPIIKLIFKKSK